MTAVVLMAAPCTKSLGGRSGGHKGGTRGREEVNSGELAGRSPPSLVGTGTVQQVFTEAEATSLQVRRGTDVR